MTPHPSSPASVGTSDLDTLLDLLARQRDLYQELQGLSARQQSIIAQGQTEQLLLVLSERQVLVDRLTAINKDLAPLRGRMSELTDGASEDTRMRIRGLVDEVQQLLASIIDRDEQDRRHLEASKASVGQELSRVNTAPAAINAYKSNAFRKAAGPALVGAARFTDSRG